MSKTVIKISNDLIEAYEGYYEDEMAADLTSPMEEPEDARNWAINKIISHTPKERLEIYLEWNGIIGYADRTYQIATGEL